MSETKNAIITRATITTEYGILNVELSFDYGSMCQQLGGYVLYLPKSCKHHKVSSIAGHYIFRIMELAGVTKWDSMVGRTVRVICEHEKIHAIGHIVKDDWYFLANEMYLE